MVRKHSMCDFNYVGLTTIYSKKMVVGLQTLLKDKKSGVLQSVA